MAAVVINVPVNGADAPVKLVVPEELTIVFIRLSPVPPCQLNRFNT